MKISKKLILAPILGAAISFFLLSALADDISVNVNGQKIISDTPAMVINDRTVVPLRAVSEALNCDITWDDTTKGVNIYRNNTLYMMWLNHDTAFKLSPVSIEGYYDLDTPPVVINDRTLIPLRAVGELLGAKVDWDQASLTASVDLALGEKESNSGYAENLISYEQSMFKMYQPYRDYVHGTHKTTNAAITLADGRKIELELYPDIAPKTVANFVSLAKSGFYSNLIFHRVINGFMIQGGGFTESNSQKSASTIYGEFIANGYLNLIPHEKGVISMARTMASFDSASSQFFIMQQNNAALDGDYAAFGRVVSGLDVIDDIAAVKTDANDKPLTNIVIKSVDIIEN